MCHFIILCYKARLPLFISVVQLQEPSSLSFHCVLCKINWLLQFSSVHLFAFEIALWSSGMSLASGAKSPLFEPHILYNFVASIVLYATVHSIFRLFFPSMARKSIFIFNIDIPIRIFYSQFSHFLHCCKIYNACKYVLLRENILKKKKRQEYYKF